MRGGEQIKWRELIPAEKVRPSSRTKYFSPSPLQQAMLSRFLKVVADLLAEKEWNSLLDVGCGEGFVLYYLSRHFPGRLFVGLEPDEAALEAAAQLNPHAFFLRGDGRHLPFPSRSFDALVCTEVLEHVSYYEELLQEMGRVTTGLCLISVPAWPWYQAAHFLSGRHWHRGGEHPEHVRRFSRRTFAQAMREHLGGELTTIFSFPWLIGRCEMRE